MSSTSGYCVSFRIKRTFCDHSWWLKYCVARKALLIERTSSQVRWEYIISLDLSIICCDLLQNVLILLRYCVCVAVSEFFFHLSLYSLFMKRWTTTIFTMICRKWHAIYGAEVRQQKKKLYKFTTGWITKIIR